MRAGDLKHTIVFQRKGTTRDAYGGEAESWINHRAVWAAVEPLSNREFVDLGLGQTEEAVRFVIRYREDIDARMQIVWRGRVYRIEGPPLLDPNRRSVEILAVYSSAT